MSKPKPNFTKSVHNGKPVVKIDGEWVPQSKVIHKIQPLKNDLKIDPKVERVDNLKSRGVFK